MKKINFKGFAILIVLLSLLAACSPVSQPTAQPGGPSPVPGETPGSQTAVSPVSIATPLPTATAEPGKLLLIADAALSSTQPIQALLTELSGPAGLSVETRPTLGPGDLSAAVKMVLFLAPPSNLADLLNAAPQTQFVVQSSSQLPQAGNLTVIHQAAEYRAFLGGFIATLLSTDYRAAGLLPSDGPLGASLKDAFVNGGHYYCGACAPGWPWNIYYPVASELPGASDGPAWQQAAAGLFDDQKVEVYYLSPQALRPEVIDYLNGRIQFEKTILLLGEQTPPAALRAQWAVTIGFDTASALRQIWPDVLAGKGGAVVEAPLLLEDLNADLLGEGRQRLVMELMEEIKKKRIYPFTIPAQ